MSKSNTSEPNFRIEPAMRSEIPELPKENSRAEKYIYKHLNINDLEDLFKKVLLLSLLD